MCLGKVVMPQEKPPGILVFGILHLIFASITILYKFIVFGFLLVSLVFANYILDVDATVPLLSPPTVVGGQVLNSSVHPVRGFFQEIADAFGYNAAYSRREIAKDLLDDRKRKPYFG